MIVSRHHVEDLPRQSEVIAMIWDESLCDIESDWCIFSRKRADALKR